MKQRGRKSQAQLSTTAPVQEIPRVPPPAELSEYEAHVWSSVVNTKPADWFQSDTLPLLLSYCKHISQTQTIDREISEFEPEWLKTDDGLKRYKLLTDMRDRESRAMTALARAMRLSQQARVEPKTAGRAVAKHSTGRRPWES